MLGIPPPIETERMNTPAPPCSFRLLLRQEIAVCLFAPTALYAQHAPAGRGDAHNVVYLAPLVNVGDADDGQDPYTRPAPVSALDAEHIDLMGSQNLDDALRTLPGVFTRDNVQNPGVAVNIRGLEGSGRVNMSLDGIRQNFRFTGHEAQGFVYVDTALLAGVEIERGVVSGAGGAGTLTGRANFRTLGVEDVLGDNAFGGFINLGHGSNKVSDSEVVATGARRGGWALIGAISRRSPDDYKNGNGERVDHTGQDLVSAVFKAEYKPDDSQRLNVGAVLYDNDFTANSYTQSIESRQYSVNYVLTPSGNDFIDLRVNLYRSDVSMRYEAAPAIPGGGTAAGRVVGNLGNGFDVSNTSYFSENIHSTYGVEYFHDDYRVKNSAAVPGRGVNGPGKSTIASVFTDTTFNFGPASVITGLRYDRFTLKGSGSVSTSNPVGLPGGAYRVDRSDGYVSPKLTVAIQASDWLQPYLSWGKSQRAPTISETFIGGEHPAGAGAPRQSFFPNPFLKPEKMAGAEAGFNLLGDGVFTPEDIARLKVNYFRHKVKDYVTADMSNGTHFANVAGKSIIKGFEIEGAYDAGFVFANVSYSDTESKLPTQINGFGAQSYQPDSVFTTMLGARVLDRRLSFGARHFRSSRAFIGAVNAAMFGTSEWEPGYQLTDIFANYRFDSGMELRLNVSNVGDTAYNPVLSTAPGGTAAKAGRGRTANVQVRFNF